MPGIAEDGRGAGEKEPVDAVPGHGLHHLDGGLKREPQVERVVGVSQRDVRIGREVKDRLEARVGEQPVERLALEHVELVEMKPLARPQLLNVFFAAQVQVVDAPDLVAGATSAFRDDCR